jgi:hypothetical protein
MGPIIYRRAGTGDENLSAVLSALSLCFIRLGN